MTLRTRLLTRGTLLALVLANPALAQTTYTYTGIADNNGASQWDVLTNWDQPVAPGSLLNGTAAVDDIVVIRNNEGNGTQQRIRLTLDAGTIGSLEIGGIGAAGSTGSTQLQLRGAGPRLTVTGDVTLGSTFGGGQRAGQINFANSNSAMTVNGNVVSGSTSGGNNINVNQGATSTFTLMGDIDSAAARAAIGGVAVQEIDVIVSRTEGLVLGGGVQELSLESFYILSTGANVGSITQTVGVDKSVNAIDGRVGSVVNNNPTATGTLAVDGGVITYTNNLVVGRAQHQGGGSNDTANATGNLNVGGANAGLVTVNGQLILGSQEGTTGTNAQQAHGNVTVSTAGSVLNLNGGVNIGATVQAGGTTSGSLTINGGLVRLAGGITEDAAQVGNSSLNLNGGELELLDALGGTRSVDTLSHTGTGVLDFTVQGGMPTLATTDTALSASAGGSLIDVTTAPAGTTFSTTDLNTWTGGGTGASPDGTWDGEGADWSKGVTPDAGFGSIGAGENFVLVSSANAITGDAGAAVLTGSATGAGWSLTQNSNDLTLTAGSAIGGGLGVAHFADGTADVTRSSDLNIEAAAGTGADATQINIDDVNSLSLTGAANLNVGGVAAGGVVNQGNIGGGSTGGMAVAVGGNVVLADGSVYNLNEGSLAVGGVSLSGTALDGELIINSSTPNSFTSTGPVAVDHLRVGQDTTSNASITVNYALDARLVDIAEDGAARGSLTVDNGGSLTTTGRVYVAGDQTGNQDANTVGSLALNTGGQISISGGNLEVGRDGAGSFTVNGGTYTQLTGNLVLGQNGTNPDTAAKGTMVMNSGIANIGDAANGPLNSNLNLNAGGGSFTLNDGLMNIENVLNMTDQGGENSSVTVNGGTLNVGANIAYRGGSGTDSITIAGGTVNVTGSVLLNTSSSNFLVIDGSGGSLAIGNDLTVNGTGTVQFNPDAGGVQTIAINDQLLLAGGTGNIAFDFTNFLAGGNTALTVGDIVLLEALGLGDGGAQATGVQAWTTPFGTQVSPNFGDGSFYTLEEAEGSLVHYLKAVPEPGSISLLALSGLLFLRRKR